MVMTDGNDRQQPLAKPSFFTIAAFIWLRPAPELLPNPASYFSTAPHYHNIFHYFSPQLMLTKIIPSLVEAFALRQSHPVMSLPWP